MSNEENYVCSHSGDAGDLIAALPGIASRGNGVLTLYPDDCTGRRMTREKAEALIPLLELQPYIKWVEWAEQHITGDRLDNWRDNYRNHLSLADMQSEYMGVPHWPRDQPWLTVPEPNKIARVVFHRSERYHQDGFPWPRIYRKYYREAVFIGLPKEHGDFCFWPGPISYYPTSNYLELARVIAGAELYVGNQSSPFWVACGMCQNLILEVCMYCQNCHWNRPNFIYGTNDQFDLPELTPQSFNPPKDRNEHYKDHQQSILSV